MLSGDISNFDASVPPEVLWSVALAISKWLDKTARNIFLSIVHSDIFGTYLITPNKIYEPSPSSLKSGSIFTSLMGCMVNLAIQMYGHFNHYYSMSQVCVMGDDFICCGEGVGPEAMEITFADFNMECNRDKQFYEQGMCHFLQKLFEMGVPGGIVSSYRTLGKLLSTEDDIPMEQEDRTAWAFTFKWLAQLNNCWANPMFETLVEFVEQGDSLNHLGASLPPEVVKRRAGEFAVKYEKIAINQPWKAINATSFNNWAVNGVLRGERLPPRGKARFQRVWGISYEAMKFVS